MSRKVPAPNSAHRHSNRDWVLTKRSVWGSAAPFPPSGQREFPDEMGEGDCFFSLFQQKLIWFFPTSLKNFLSKMGTHHFKLKCQHLPNLSFLILFGQQTEQCAHHLPFSQSNSTSGIYLGFPSYGVLSNPSCDPAYTFCNPSSHRCNASSQSVSLAFFNHAFSGIQGLDRVKVGFI